MIAVEFGVEMTSEFDGRPKNLGFPAMAKFACDVGGNHDTGLCNIISQHNLMGWDSSLGWEWHSTKPFFEAKLGRQHFLFFFFFGIKNRQQ